GVGPRSATREAGVDSIWASVALRSARTRTLTTSPATRFDSDTTVGTPCDQRRYCVFAPTAKCWSDDWPTSFFSAGLVPPLTSTYSEDELSASVIKRPLNTYVSWSRCAASVLDVPATSTISAASTT